MFIGGIGFLDSFGSRSLEGSAKREVFLSRSGEVDQMALQTLTANISTSKQLQREHQARQKAKSEAINFLDAHKLD